MKQVMYCKNTLNYVIVNLKILQFRLGQVATKDQLICRTFQVFRFNICIRFTSLDHIGLS